MAFETAGFSLRAGKVFPVFRDGLAVDYNVVDEVNGCSACRKFVRKIDGVRRGKSFHISGVEVVSEELLGSDVLVEIEEYNAVRAAVDNFERAYVFDSQRLSFLNFIRLDVRPVFEFGKIISRDVLFDDIAGGADEFFADFSREALARFDDIRGFNDAKRYSCAVSGNRNRGDNFAVVIFGGSSCVPFLNALAVDIDVCGVVVVFFEFGKFVLAHSEVEIHREGISCGHSRAGFVFR